MKLSCAWEHNGNDSLLYFTDYPGAYTRGAFLDEALSKVGAELRAYLRWNGEPWPGEPEPVIVQEKTSTLRIADADSDLLLDSERPPLTEAEYARLRDLALRSARDFHALFHAVPDPEKSALPARETFYGGRPRTAAEMYAHTKNINGYYFGEIGVEIGNEGTIYDCRAEGFARLETVPGFLENPVVSGSYDELWSLRKVLRRFLWHDRIHAKAMYRMALRTFGPGSVPDVFRFGPTA